MKNYRKHIDDFFREKLGNYTETPPPEVWEALEKRLDGLPPTLSARPYKWLWHFGMVSLILLFGLSLVKKATNNGSVLAINNPAVTTNDENAETNSKETGRSIVKEQNTNTLSTNDVLVADEAGNNIETTDANKKQGVTKTSNLPVSTNTKHNIEAKSGLNEIKKQINQARLSTKQSSIYNSNPVTDNNDNEGRVYGSTNSTNNNNNANTKLKSDSENELPPLPKKNEENKKQSEDEQKKQQIEKPIVNKGKFDFGVKVGYEMGFNNDAATKYVVAPYVFYKIGNKLSVGTQPAVKYASINEKSISSASYYKIKSSEIAQIGESEVTTYIDGGTTYDIYKTKYNYTQKHDSLVKKTSVGGSYWETELPVLVKYTVCPKVSFYGGLNIVYSQATTITEHTTIVADIAKSTVVTNESRNSATPLPIDQVINYPGQNTMSDYNGPITHSQTNAVRFGIAAGVTYNLANRWMLDALIQKNSAQTDVKNNYNLNNTLSAPYIRLSIGYKLSK